MTSQPFLIVFREDNKAGGEERSQVEVTDLADQPKAMITNFPNWSQKGSL
jgi:hypothetical protein